MTAAHHRGPSVRPLRQAVWTLGFLVLAVSASSCFPKAAGPRLAHFSAQAPQPGSLAPALELQGLDGKAIRLVDLTQERPVVLQLGSHSCPVYRYRRHWMDDLWQDYAGRVHFLIVYTREAHPVGSESPYRDGEWDLLLNRMVGVRVAEPEDSAARRAQAERSSEALSLPVPVVVDGMDNAVWRTWGAASSPAFVIDRGGAVVLAQPWVRPGEIRRVLDELLAR